MAKTDLRPLFLASDAMRPFNGMNTLRVPILFIIALSVIASPATAQFYTPIVLNKSLTKFIGLTSSLSATVEFIQINPDYRKVERWPVRVFMLKGMTRVEMDISKDGIEFAAEEGTRFKQYVEDMKTAGSAESVSIINPGKEAVFLLLPRLNSYMSYPSPDVHRGQILRAPKREMVETGREEINGHSCIIYKVTFEQDVPGDDTVTADTATAFVWIAKEFGDCPLRISVMNAFGETSMSLMLTDIDLKAPAAELFEPPKDSIKYKNREELMKRVLEKWPKKNGQPVTQKSLVEELRAKADKGDAEAQYRLGGQYAIGLGDIIKKDEAEAAKWYRKAADQGHVPAQAAIGVMYVTGLGVKMDRVEAYKWLLLAAEQRANESINFNLEMAERDLTPAQRAEGERLAREFKPKKTPPPKSP